MILPPEAQLAITSIVSEAAATSVRQYAAFRDSQYAAQYETLRKAEAVRDSLLMEAPLGVASLDRGMRYRLVNETLAQMHGVPRAATSAIRRATCFPTCRPRR